VELRRKAELGGPQKSSGIGGAEGKGETEFDYQFTKRPEGRLKGCGMMMKRG